jgi:hypothetical protein
MQSKKCSLIDQLQQENEKLRNQTIAYKKELSVLHARVRTYHDLSKTLDSTFKMIDDLDYIKHRLIHIGGSRQSLKNIIRNPSYKYQLEELFACPFDDIPDKFYQLLNERNKICHRYTSREWMGPIK